MTSYELPRTYHLSHMGMTSSYHLAQTSSGFLPISTTRMWTSSFTTSTKMAVSMHFIQLLLNMWLSSIPTTILGPSRLMTSSHMLTALSATGQVGVLCCAVLCCAVLCCAVLCCAVPCCALPCPAVLCPAVPCRAMPCRALPCCAVPCTAGTIMPFKLR